MGCSWYDIHSLIWIYRQLYFIVCIYIRCIKSSGMLGMVSVETTSSACIDFGWQLYFIVCIYTRGIKSSDARGMGWWGGRSFLLLTAKIVSICADEVGTNHPIFFRQSLSSSSGAPQWLVLPVAWWKAQCAEVNFGIFCEECLHLVQHVISRRYDIEEVLDDAHIKIHP